MRKQLRVRAWSFKQHTTNVGGGLPPNAVVQSINSVTDTALSRASPLPQGVCARFERCVSRQLCWPDLPGNAKTNVGGGLPPKTVVQSINSVTDIALSRASPLPHFLIFSVLEIGSDQNAGRIAPLYFSRMNAFTSGVCRAATSFFTASESLLSSL